MTVTTGQNGTNGKPINKGTILKLSVDHIKELKEEVVSYKNKIQELEHLVDLAKKNGSIKQEDLYSHQVLQSMISSQTNNRRHERIGSIQFQQQFGKLHINSEEQQQV
ncbi:hypothetical protein BD560DRAFT_99185 [Blakeslea trispora]|nr:hypothetical protein BD560DRAFT_99185 [Blakeslea trispora]